jgi:GrpB-like predicted nucleotidyltransferase (UPF0157 family)
VPAPSAEQRAIHEEVHLVPYDARWPVLFEKEQERLLSLFPQLLAVEHFGSTAVPGLTAKPIIDLLAGVASMDIADSLFEPLLASGYTTSREFNAMLADRRWFMRSCDGRRTHHLHVVVHGGPVWLERLRFRDLLRTDPSVASSYARLKSELALRFRQDREAYTDAKAQFVEAALAGRMPQRE